MSLMDLFTYQGEVGPSSGSSGGNWKDWFLDMKGRRPFGRTIRPDSGSKKGDWIDWFLNREGLAGRFEGSRRPRYRINSLFNNGGSVRSSSGPKRRQELQPKEKDSIISYDIGKNFNYPIEVDSFRPEVDSFRPYATRNFLSNDFQPEGIMSMADNRTSINPSTWHQSPYFGIGGYDFAKDHAPEYLDYFQEIKDEDAMARDAGWYPYFNPSLIKNNPSFGLDYMADILGGKGRVGFRKGLDDDNYNAYANWGIEF